MKLGMLRDVPHAGWAVVLIAVMRAAAVTAAALLLGRGVDRVIAGEGALAALSAAGVAVLAAAALEAVERLAPVRAQAREEAAWRARAMRAELAAPLDDDEPTGQRIARATEEVERFAHYRAAFLGPLVAAFVVPVVVLVVIAALVSAGLAGVLAVCVALIPVVIGGFMARFRASSGRYRRLSGQLAAGFLETMRARHTIRMLGAAGERRRVLAARSEGLRAEVMRLLARNQLVILVTDAVFGVVALAVVGTAAVAGTRDGWLTPGTAVALLVLSGLLREPVDSLGRSFYVGLAGRASGERVRAALEAAESDDVAPEEALRPEADPVLSLRGARVRRGDAWPIRDADLDVPATGLTALVGRSGAGKSSLALGIAGLAHAEGIRVDGRPAERADLLGLVAYVPQRSQLFTGTVRENLLLADSGASDADLRGSLAAAGFPRGGDELPQGLDTPVGEGARGVSGGQAQRICLARALLTRRPVLVADEVTAHLDPETAEGVTRTIADLARERAVVMITHRDEEAALADRVGVVDEGRTALAPPSRSASAEGGAR
ncbi:ATP-binding cassette domain-containing protein [Microbacterium sp. gxy059]|uniref:ATP-binding cassette domain-containing protein n=1 Tax=Microbacterium sp. gxy059 TaxID=2957199 RepID=UPI003D987FCB